MQQSIDEMYFQKKEKTKNHFRSIDLPSFVS